MEDEKTNCENMLVLEKEDDYKPVVSGFQQNHDMSIIASEHDHERTKTPIGNHTEVYRASPSDQNHASSLPNICATTEACLLHEGSKRSNSRIYTKEETIHVLVHTNEVSFLPSQSCYDDKENESNSSICVKDETIGIVLDRDMEWIKPSRSISDSTDKEPNSSKGTKEETFEIVLDQDIESSKPLRPISDNNELHGIAPLLLKRVPEDTTAAVAPRLISSTPMLCEMHEHVNIGDIIKSNHQQDVETEDDHAADAEPAYVTAAARLPECRVRLTRCSTVGAVPVANQCPMCYMAFTTPEYFNRHCQLCRNRGLFSAQQLELLGVRVSTAPVEDELTPKQAAAVNVVSTRTCKFCLKSFSKPIDCRRHERIHTADRPFACQYCDKKFTQAGSRRMHERIHTNEKKIKCSFCNKMFNQSAHRKKHELTHTGIRAHHCCHCAKSFASASDCRKHERIHLKEKPYSCTLCSYTSNDSAHLHIHERTHSGEKPFACALCSYKCTNSSNLHRHGLRAHNVSK